MGRPPFAVHLRRRAARAARLVVDKDLEVCGKRKLFDESLVVDKESRGIANIVMILLKPARGELPVHESYGKSPTEPAKIVSRNCRFEPHVLLMRTSQPFHLVNEGLVGVNPKLEVFANPATSALVPASGRIELDLSKEEPGPVRLECSIHGWMSAIVIVRGDNPYSAVSDKQGHVKLQNVPAGEWTFRLWHERTLITQARRGDKTVDWPRGRMKLTIESGTIDLGAFRLPAKMFERK